MIEIKKHSELNIETRITLEKIIDGAFGHTPIVKETEWAKPDWTIIYYVDNEIATFYNIVERTITIDDIEIDTAGINNVITPAAFRGKGLATKLLRDTESLIFNDLYVDLALLKCADDLIPFYERLNWYKIDSLVFFNQSKGERLWGANTMLLTKGEKVIPKIIKLNGLPW